MGSPDLAAAEQFIAANARVLERRRHERFAGTGDARALHEALGAYRNADGGYGHALEPDGRCPDSQPPAMDYALRVLHQDDAWNDDFALSACDWLERNAPADGGVIFVAPSIEGWPHAPWWVPEDRLPPSLAFTGQLSATLQARGVDHSWLARSSELMWKLIDRVEQAGAYDLRGALAFLDQVPDRDRAETALERLAPLVLEAVELDPEAAGEVHGPLDFAPRPQSLARRLFDEATIEAHLDHLAGAQLEDGGWTFNWLAWSPVAAVEWRGVRTVEALHVLRANGRL